ncbi:MAG: glucokinase [Acidobacteriota bacterium]|jgi:glucokinase|nr:glucokinase [Acidobacteriota bacterium]
MIIAGDIGGTKTNVALFEAEGDKLTRVVLEQSFPSGGYDSLEAILAEFVEAHRPDKITHACFGVAGPVSEGRAETSNLAWYIRSEKLAETLGVRHVGLINDLEATAYGIEWLRPEQLYTLNEGEAGREGHRALIAAGTGLGMAGIFFDGQHYHPMASEGGHIDFAPRNEHEFRMLLYLREQLGGRVSYERVLSGMGLFNIYSFLRDTGYGPEPVWLAEEIKSGDRTAAVSRAGLAGKSDLAVKALEMLVEVYGAMAGNLALLLKSFGGLYVGGGIAPKIIEKLKDGTFMRNYSDKGRMSALVNSIPVRVILDDKTALYGAARCALMGEG